MALIACAISCQKDDRCISTRNSTEMFVRVSDGAAMTKSKSSLAQEKLCSMPFITDSGDTLSLDVFISDMPEQMSAPVMTKGQIITTDNIPTTYGSFTTSVFKDGSAYTDAISEKTMTGVTVTYDEGEWTFGGGPYYWPKEENLTFCSMAPVNATGVSNVKWTEGGSKLSFDYSMPAARMDGEGKYHDAENQKDLLFAINTQKRTDHDNYAQIEFSHALTAVRFIRGDIKDCKIKAIGLSGFYGAGSAVAVPNATPGDSRKLSFTWTPGGELQDFRQTFDVTLDDSIVHQDPTQSAITEGSSLDPTESQEYTFMIIPQEMQDASKLLVFIDGKPNPIEVLLKSTDVDDKLKDWSAYAGKVITIKVNMANIGSVEIDEIFDSSEKKDVGAKNTGNVPVFVRAAVVANWVNEAGDALMTCDITTEGELKNYLLPDSNWKLHTDGYIYYTKAIAPDSITAGKIFTKYVPAKLPSSSFHHLDVVILLQSVEYDSECSKARAAWGIPEGILTSDIE